MTETLNISDGTTTINLINPAGINLIEWIPKVANPTTVGRESAIADFSAPVSRSYQNIAETFRLYVVGTSQNNVISQLNALTTLLEQAARYHTSNGVMANVVYLTAKSDSETNTRYAAIYNYRIEEIPQVHQDSPFKIGGTSDGTSYASVLQEIVLVIERSHWLENAPWTGTAIMVSTATHYPTTSSLAVNNSYTTTTKNYLEINSNQLGGELPPKFKLAFNGGSATCFIGGLRSTSRGANFGSIINCTDVLTHNPDETWYSHVNTAPVADAKAPAGKSAYYGTSYSTVPSAPSDPFALGSFVIGSTNASHYQGRYRVFLRGRGYIQDPFWLKITDDSTLNVVSTSASATFVYTSGYDELLDLGVIDIPFTNSTIIMNLMSQRITGAGSALMAAFYDLVLIPADECFFMVEAQSEVWISGTLSRILEVNGIKDGYPSLDLSGASGVESQWIGHIGNDLVLSRNSTQRLWIINAHKTDGIDATSFGITTNSVINVYRSKRYLSLRGTG